MGWNVFERPVSKWNHFWRHFDLEFIIGGAAIGKDEWSFYKSSGGQTKSIKSGIVAEPFFRLYLPIKGKFAIEYSFGSFEVSPGAIYLFPPWLPFHFESVSPCSHYWVHFVSEQLRYLPSASKPHKLEIDQSQIADRRGVFRKILKLAAADPDISQAFEMRMSLEALVLPFIELLQHEEAGDALYIMELKPAVEYIEEHFTEQIRIEELSNVTGLPRAKFSKRFNAAFGLPPKQYISTRRISHAKHLLIETDMTIKEIADQCGFENEFFFYRIFKSYSRISPGAFRKQYGP